MGRYVIHYRQHLACFNCRKMFQRKNDYKNVLQLVCPQCGQQMHNMGLDFKAPKQTDLEQWAKVEMLARNGIIFEPEHGTSGGPGYRPRRLREVPQFLESIKQKSPGDVILDHLPKHKSA